MPRTILHQAFCHPITAAAAQDSTLTPHVGLDPNVINDSRCQCSDWQVAMGGGGDPRSWPSGARQCVPGRTHRHKQTRSLLPTLPGLLLPGVQPAVQQRRLLGLGAGAAPPRREPLLPAGGDAAQHGGGGVRLPQGEGQRRVVDHRVEVGQRRPEGPPCGRWGLAEAGRSVSHCA